MLLPLAASSDGGTGPPAALGAPAAGLEVSFSVTRTSPIGGELTYRFGPDDVALENGRFATERTAVSVVAAFSQTGSDVLECR